MILGFVAKLGFSPKSTNIGAQKIDNLLLKSYGMVSARFLLKIVMEKSDFLKRLFCLLTLV